VCFPIDSHVVLVVVVSIPFGSLYLLVEVCTEV
jgi:hypothetical protein